jgi:hemerythrin superfamily protein
MQEDEEKEDFQSFFLEHQQVKELIQYLATAHNETDQKIDTIVSDFVKIVSSTV